MIYLEIPRDGPAVAYEMSDPQLLQITVAQAYGKRAAIPESVPEAVAFLRSTVAELATFTTWDEAGAWALTLEGMTRVRVEAALARYRQRPGFSSTPIRPAS